MLPKYTAPFLLDVILSGEAAVSLIVSSVRFCAWATEAKEVNATTATIRSRTFRGVFDICVSRLSLVTDTENAITLIVGDQDRRASTSKFIAARFAPTST